MTTASRGGSGTHRGGKPNQGLGESAWTIRGPASLAEAAKASAREQGITSNEWWRRAGRVRLGLPEVDPATRARWVNVDARVSPTLAELIESSSAAGAVDSSEWLRRAALLYLAAGAPDVVPEIADDEEEAT